MESNTPERRVIVCFSLDKAYFRTDANSPASYTEKNIQHVMRDWFPGAVFEDLTDDTTRLDVVVRKGLLGNRNVYGTSFHRADGSLIKKKDYDEDRLVGQTSPHHDKKADEFVGRVHGADVRLIVYRK